MEKVSLKFFIHNLARNTKLNCRELTEQSLTTTTTPPLQKKTNPNCHLLFLFNRNSEARIRRLKTSLTNLEHWCGMLTPWWLLNQAGIPQTACLNIIERIKHNTCPLCVTQCYPVTLCDWQYQTVLWWYVKSWTDPRTMCTSDTELEIPIFLLKPPRDSLLP